MFDEIDRSCETWMAFSCPPLLFRVTAPPDKFITNEEVAIDLAWLGGKAIIRVVDCHTQLVRKPNTERRSFEPGEGV